MSTIPKRLRPAYEKQIQIIHLGCAGACFAGILALFSLNDLEFYVWLALFFFCVGLPFAISRSLMSLAAQMVEVYPDAVRWTSYNSGWMSVLPMLSGYALMIYSLSEILCITFLVCSTVGFLTVMHYARSINKV